MRFGRGFYLLLGIMACMFMAGCDGVLDESVDDDVTSHEGSVNEDVEGELRGAALDEALSIECPIPDDQTAWEGVRYWRGEACDRLITGECAGQVIQPVFNCAQSCTYRVVVELGPIEERAQAAQYLGITCQRLQDIGSEMKRRCIPCDGY